MSTVKEIQEQLKAFKGFNMFAAAKEIAELPSILFDDEQIEAAINGKYSGWPDQGIVLATNSRLILVHKKAALFKGQLDVMDFTYDRIASVQSQTGPLQGKVIVHVAGMQVEIDKVPSAIAKAFTDYLRQRIGAQTAPPVTPVTSSPDISGQPAQQIQPTLPPAIPPDPLVSVVDIPAAKPNRFSRTQIILAVLGVCIVCAAISSVLPRQTPAPTAAKVAATDAPKAVAQAQPTIAPAAAKPTDAPKVAVATNTAPPPTAVPPTITPRPPTNTPGPTNTPRPTNTPLPPSPKMGGEARVQIDGSEIVPLAADEAAFDAFTRAATRNDTFGINDLIQAGKLFTVPTGTKVLVIDMGGFLGSRLQVRVLEGPRTGRAGWVATEFVKALP